MPQTEVPSDTVCAKTRMVYSDHDIGFCIMGLSSTGGQNTEGPLASICVPGFVYINNYLMYVWSTVFHLYEDGVVINKTPIHF